MVSAVAFALLALGAASDAAPLPDVDTVLSQANNKALDFAAQAKALQQRLASQQEKSRVALARQKAEYEQTIYVYGNQSEAISAKNSNLRAFNSHLARANEEMVEDLQKLRGDNAAMRGTLKSIANKVSVAHEFLEDSLKVTDDADAQELEVLASTTRRPTLESFLAATVGGEVSLLAVSARGDGPEDLVDVLSSSLADIANADAEGAAELKAQFLARLEEAQKRQAWLNATQEELLARRAELKAQEAKLMEARTHLRATGRQLRERLEGMRVFADKIDGSVASSLGRSGAANTTANATSAQAGEASKATAFAAAAAHGMIKSNATVASFSQSMADVGEGRKTAAEANSSRAVDGKAKAVGSARAVAAATSKAAPKAPLTGAARRTSLRRQKKPASAAARAATTEQGELGQVAPARLGQWLAKLR